MWNIEKKNGRTEEYNSDKIRIAIQKSANRALYEFKDGEKDKVVNIIEEKLTSMNIENISVYTIHSLVENALDEVAPSVAKSYKDYRNYKKESADMLDSIYQEANRIQYLGDKENANTDSTLVSTKRSLILNELNKEMYKKFQLNPEEVKAIYEGYIYIHDMSARRDTMNCGLFRLGDVMRGGFEMSNVWYNEPKTVDVAFDVGSDVIISAASQQYGGFSVCRVDTIMAYYAEKSYNYHINKYINRGVSEDQAKEWADLDTKREIEQGYQGWEMKFNTVSSSRGDYPFISITFGLDTSYWGKIISKTILNVHKKGQGKDGFKKPVLFPKLIFLYDKKLHGPGCINEDVFEAGIDCSRKTMYPDWLSLSGKGYISEIYQKYGEVISPMGRDFIAHL